MSACYWLLELRNNTRMNPGSMPGYVQDLNHDNGITLVFTREAYKAIRFPHKEAAQGILDDTAFIHAYGTDHGIEPIQHMFIREPTEGCA